jgi:hypothetical protein
LKVIPGANVHQRKAAVNSRFVLRTRTATIPNDDLNSGCDDLPNSIRTIVA